LMGFLASACCPPFGPFFGAYQLASAAFMGGRAWIGGLFLACLALTFLASSKTALGAALGAAPTAENHSSMDTPYRDTPGTVAPIAAALAAALLMGIWMPTHLSSLLDQAAAIVRGQ
jgi:hydrogenase-4 component F